MKKALMNASVASMIYKFNMDNIDILENLGYKAVSYTHLDVYKRQVRERQLC